MIATPGPALGSPPRRVALVHDWLTGMRGGERALEAICDLFPDATRFALLHVPGSVSATIEARPIHTSFIQWLPQSSIPPLIHLGSSQTQPIPDSLAHSIATGSA